MTYQPLVTALGTVPVVERNIFLRVPLPAGSAQSFSTSARFGPLPERTRALHSTAGVVRSNLMLC